MLSNNSMRSGFEKNLRTFSFINSCIKIATTCVFAFFLSANLTSQISDTAGPQFLFTSNGSENILKQIIWRRRGAFDFLCHFLKKIGIVYKNVPIFIREGIESFFVFNHNSLL